MIVLARGRFGSAPARVLEQVRRSGALTREELARLTGLSPATVARTTATLVDECLLRERPDLVRAGSVGRPSSPLEIDSGRHSVLGVHIGQRVTTVGLVGLDGRVVGQSRLRTQGDEADLVARVVRHANLLVAGSEERTVLAAGLVAPWGEVAYDEATLAARLEVATGLEVSTANHVAAVVAAEYLGKRRSGDGCTAYVYVRDTAGFALANDLPDRTEISRAATLTHFPTREAATCSCGATGCLAAVASDHALARRAYDEGVVDQPEIDALLTAARGGSRPAHLLLCERGRVLGATTAVLRDMISPDRMVLVGQAFTGYPPALEEVIASFDAATTLPPIELSFTRFGTGVQAAAAGTVGLGPVFEDPLASVGRPARPQAVPEPVPVSSPDDPTGTSACRP
jgi:predicted NBD/HSP70 family sugar kinase